MIRRIVALALLALVGCGGSDSTGTSAVLTTLTVVVSPNALQVGETATASATAADQNGAIMSTGAVTWSSSSPNATITADGKVTAVSPGAVIISGSTGGKSAQAALTIVPMPPVALRIVTFPPGTIQNRLQIIPAPVVQLLNAIGGTVAQAGLTVTASASVGSMVGTFTATTDANGRATFSSMGFASRVLGARNLVFSSTGLTSASTSVSVTVGPPAIGIVTAGNNQSARVGTAVPVAPSILVLDPDSSATPGISMEFVVTSGGGTVTGSPAVTNAAGVATLGSWSLGPAVGVNTLQVRPVGFIGGVVFSATGIAESGVMSPLQLLTGKNAQRDNAARTTFRFNSPIHILGCNAAGC